MRPGTPGEFIPYARPQGEPILIKPDREALAIIRLTLEHWPGMTAEQRVTFTNICEWLGASPAILVGPPPNTETP